LEQALALNFQDFEDAEQYACAMVYNVDAIVTRDASGFVNAEIPVVLPDQLDTISNSE
jgi:predicted nucleic acid-binding protein